MSFLGDVFSFEAFNLKDMLKRAAKNPAQLLLGAADPFSANMWSKITGKKFEPLVNQWGGASDGAYQRAQAAGINTGPGSQMHQAAQAIASLYAAGAGAGALGGAAGGGGGGGAAAGGGGAGGGAAAGGGAGSSGGLFGNLFGSGATATNSVGPLASGYAYTPTVANSVGPLAGGYNYGMAGAFGAQVPGATAVSANGGSLFGTGGAPGNGLTFDQMMQMAQNIPQGSGQQDNQAPAAGGLGSAPRGNGKLDPIAKGEVNYSRRRRKKSFLGG